MIAGTGRQRDADTTLIVLVLKKNVVPECSPVKMCGIAFAWTVISSSDSVISE